MRDNKTYVVKCVVLGDYGAGKSSILARYCHNKYTEYSHTTIGADFFIKTIKQGSTTIKAQLWDTAGQEKYKAMLVQYIRNAYLYIIVFDVTDTLSFIGITEWITYIVNNVRDDYRIILLANKIDNVKERKVSYEDAKLFAKIHKMDYFEVSAKNDLNITETFNDIFLDMLKNIESISNNLNVKTIDNLDDNLIEPVNNKSNITNKCTC